LIIAEQRRYLIIKHEKFHVVGHVDDALAEPGLDGGGVGREFFCPHALGEVRETITIEALELMLCGPPFQGCITTLILFRLFTASVAAMLPELRRLRQLDRLIRSQPTLPGAGSPCYKV
jgi:hypothetical protein